MASNLATLMSGGRVLPGEQLQHRVGQAAGAMRALGLEPGHVVCMLMRNDFPMLEVALAAERIGVVAVPLNWHATSEDLHYILNDAGARILVAHTDLLDKAPSVPAGCVVIQVPPPPEVRAAYRLTDSESALRHGVTEYETWLTSAPTVQAATASPPFRLLYTSGSTGRPKGVRRDARDAGISAAMSLRTRVAHGMEAGPMRAVMTGPL
ncbi:MAG: AMP-binding protein, partial [Burkholderiaceae bacterium]